MSNKARKIAEWLYLVWGFGSLAAMIGAIYLGSGLPRLAQIGVVALCGSWYAVERWRGHRS